MSSLPSPLILEKDIPMAHFRSISLIAGSGMICLTLLPSIIGAQVVNPNDFVTGGAFNSVAGAYTVNTDTLSLTGPSGFFAPGVLSGNIAVFDFASISFNAGSTLSGTGSHAFALLSRTDATFAGSIDIRFGPGGFAGGPSFSAANGSGPGGGAGNPNGAGGGGFGGAGGNGSTNVNQGGASGGAAYGDLSVLLQGGSGGGGGGVLGGGNGGGALELGAVNTLSISGSILADGRRADGSGGGGAGGGLILQGNTVMLAASSTLSAQGGPDGVANNSSGGIPGGGGGGGGRILVETGPAGGFINTGGTLSVTGGASNTTDGSRAGQAGVITFVQRTPAVPEPGIIALLVGTGLAGTGFLSRRKKARNRS